MVILAIIITMATLSIGNPQYKRISQTSQQVVGLVQIASEQAIFNAQEYGVFVWESGYTFNILTAEGWEPVPNDRIFRTRNLPDGLEFDLYLDGLKVNLDRTDQVEEREDRDDYDPQIFITSDGEISPFRLEVTDRRDWKFSIDFNERGELEVIPTET